MLTSLPITNLFKFHLINCSIISLRIENKKITEFRLNIHIQYSYFVVLNKRTAFNIVLNNSFMYFRYFILFAIVQYGEFTIITYYLLNFSFISFVQRLKFWIMFDGIFANLLFQQFIIWLMYKLTLITYAERSIFVKKMLYY